MTHPDPIIISLKSRIRSIVDPDPQTLACCTCVCVTGAAAAGEPGSQRSEPDRGQPCPPRHNTLPLILLVLGLPCKRNSNV